eukprot:7633316-Prorocentrum_lima.AAC.1
MELPVVRGGDPPNQRSCHTIQDHHKRRGNAGEHVKEDDQQDSRWQGRWRGGYSINEQQGQDSVTNKALQGSRA